MKLEKELQISIHVELKNNKLWNMYNVQSTYVIQNQH
jgi:hypothetical protein